jgi:hypothetical protein
VTAGADRENEAGQDKPGSRVLSAEQYAALIRAGDVLATRLDETPAFVGERYLGAEVKQRQQAVHEWLAIAHPNGEGHVIICDAIMNEDPDDRCGLPRDHAGHHERT